MKFPTNIEDENGNLHGPFNSMEEALEAVDLRGLGEQRDLDDAKERGWIFEQINTAS